jgi:hypothetical protein
MPAPEFPFTAGYYAVRGAWERFCNPGEEHVCDPCMHSDSRYKEIYG